MKDLLPKKAHVFADQIGRISGEYLTPYQGLYLGVKKEVGDKAKEFQGRLDKGENITSLVTEMSNYRNQISSVLEGFKRNKDTFDKWKDTLDKDKTIPSTYKTKLVNLALDNITQHVQKKGLDPDLPLPSPATPVNYDTKGAKIVDDLVEKQGREWYETFKPKIPGLRGDENWYQITADPTKFANLKKGFIERDPEMIIRAVISGLSNDPEVQSSLDQDAELHLHDLYKTSKNPNDQEYIKTNAGQLHDQLKQNKINDVANLLSWTKQGRMQSTDRTIIDNTERKAGAEREKENPNVPVYSSPQTPIKGIDVGTDFELKKKGTQIPLTEKEKKDISKMGAFPIVSTKSTKEDGYIQPKDMKESSKNLLLGISKYVDPEIEKKIKSGKDLTKKEQDLLYPQAAKIAEEAKKDIEVNSKVIGLTEKESDNINRQLFGKEKDQTVKNLGTGLSVNTKFYDKSNGQLVTLDDIKSDNNEEDKVSIQGKFTGENAYVIATGDESFAAPTQLSINNKEYIISGPEGYVDSKTGSYDNEANQALKKDKELNRIYNAKLTKIPIEIETNSGEKMNVYYNNKVQKYITSYKGVPLEASSAEHIQRYINEH